jgi:hypothetical protein
MAVRARVQKEVQAFFSRNDTEPTHYCAKFFLLERQFLITYFQQS